MNLLLNHKSLFSLAAAILVLSAFGCKKDEELARIKFLGAYSVVETCGSGNDSYEIIIIESGSSDNAIVINNLYDFGESVSATVSGNSVTIPSQLLSGITYSGNGTISGSTLTINFTVSDSVDSDNCNAICTRK
ncbi:MAG: hypothetical protein KDD10_19190 [Phaeodactylibacter sp.]|nr:hypothetical protein [Phaeodactylibacter sp.]MCB9296183.1 hypothetical protein [Lewinellaceae bacterium]